MQVLGLKLTAIKQGILQNRTVSRRETSVQNNCRYDSFMLFVKNSGPIEEPAMRAGLGFVIN